MKLAFHGATSMKTDLVTDVDLCTRAGFSGLELWGAKIDDYLRSHSLAELRTLLIKKRVQPISINSIEFIAFRGAEYPHIQDRCRRLCAICQAIECPMVVVVPSPTPSTSAGKVIDLFFPWDKVVEEYVTVLRDLSSIAGQYGARLTFEFLGFAWSSVRTPLGAWQIVQAAGCDNVGINFDACHFYGGGGELSEIDRIDPAKIYTFHLDDMEDIPKEAITDSRRLLPGLGVVPLDAICAHLEKIGYNGPCAIELFRPEYWEWDPYELAQKAHDMAVRVLSPHFHVE
jgi:2-keto-myo-inositol isomerase